MTTVPDVVRDWSGMSEDETVTNCNALKPERSRTFLEIVVSYPAFCTYPEYEGKPYYAIKFEENGETIVGFGTYNPEVLSQYLQEYFIPSAEPERKTGKWIKVGHWGRSYKCNQCGNYLDFDGVNAGRGDANFCPNCGADMRQEHEDIPMEYFESGGK